MKKANEEKKGGNEMTSEGWREKWNGFFKTGNESHNEDKKN